MSDLTKKEYQVMLSFYELNKNLSKNELLEMVPNLNGNTVGVVLSRLLKKGYLEVSEVIQTRTALARVYRPCVSFSTFLINEIGIVKVDALIKKSIDSIDDLQELRKLSIRINEAKEKLTLFEKI
ncbi:BlaI/MecI/CopY family transcriptional regulator [Enterococcus casseliflavus]|uniref:BlaI/MecI/CopY family transcriptional regulator n=1 Tax=Enterococcus casseliflavus TaxID=37734 RepID=UPI0022DFCC03|nr:BlaI/MecI/CopY family transcriptional regulator [Enterococcus casseliflavus]